MKFLTSSIRSLPNFIIIGSPKSGTTSLFNYLIQHPDIVGITRKEPHFFNISYSKNLNWYKMYFPTKSQLISNKITGEATPSYFIDPFVPKRIFSVLPDIKLILLLRNPIDRSFSHYKHSFKDGFENLSFENAIAAEEKRLENYENDLKIKSTNGNESFLEYVKKLSQYHPPNLYLFSYLKTSIYAEHLLNWLNVFQKKQILILNADEFFVEPDKIYQQVLNFLGVRNYDLLKYEKFNFGDKNKINPDIRRHLIEFFKPHNEKLFNILGTRFDWN